MMDEEVLKTIRSMATDEQVRNATVFGNRLIWLEKEDIIRLVIHLLEDLEKARTRKIPLGGIRLVDENDKR